MMFDSVLVANRGEIAVRVIRTLRTLGIRAVAVYSDADAEARHVREAHTAVRIGPAEASKSYLSIPAIVDAAVSSGARPALPRTPRRPRWPEWRGSSSKPRRGRCGRPCALRGRAGPRRPHRCTPRPRGCRGSAACG